MVILGGQHITKDFGGLTAVDKVDFKIDRGDIVGLIGPNGAGKTTLLNMISGALHPTRGEILFKGEGISGLKPHLICKKGIARTFQAVNLFGNNTVFENVLLASLYGGPEYPGKPALHGEINRLLAFSGLTHRAHVLTKDLPIAEQKLVEMTRALATKPELLLLDEVISGLNPAEIERACTIIGQINQQGITIIMVEHVMQVIMSMCSRIIVLNYGAKIAEGTPEEISTNERVIDIYLGRDPEC